jgi:hypothetical protein
MRIGYLALLLCLPVLAQTQEACRQRVADRNCVVARTPLNNSIGECGVVASFRERVLTTYDNYPAYLKRLVCELEGIFIVKSGLPMGGSGMVARFGGGKFVVLLA